MRPTFIKRIRIAFSAAIAAALICGCAATGASAPSAPSDLSVPGTILPDRIGIRTDSDYPFDAEEIMYLAGVRSTAYRQNTRYSLWDLDGDGLSELLLTAAGSGAETTGIYAYDADQNAAVLQKTYQGGAENSTLPEELIWVEGTQWPDASLIGVAEQLGDPGVRTDYYLSANYEWLSGQHVHEQGDVADEVSGKQEVSDRKQRMFLDRDRYRGDDIQILRDYYDAAADWERRDREGIEPVRKYLAAIEDIGSLRELAEYLADPETDPFCILMTLNTSLDLEDTSSWILELGEDQFSVLPRIFLNSDPAEVKAVRQDFEIPVRHLLSKAGWQEGDIDRLLKESFALEDRLLECAWNQEEDQGKEAESRFSGCLPFDEFVPRCRHFPLKEILNAYMTYFADDGEKQDITALCEEIRDAFREILEHSDWMSPEGRKQAAAKLDSMTFSVLKPDQLIDSSYLAVDREASFLDNYAQIRVNSIRHNCALAGTERIPGDWRYDIRSEIATTAENAFYYGSFNQFFILSGFVNEATYRKDMPVEEKLGKLGEVIGHELTHGFDPQGIQ